LFKFDECHVMGFFSLVGQSLVFKPKKKKFILSCLLSDELKSRVGGLKSRLDEVNKEKYVNSHYKNALQKAPFDSFESIKCVCVCVCAQPA